MVHVNTRTHLFIHHVHARTKNVKQPTQRQREREKSNSKTLFYKDCSLGLVKNLTTSPCKATDEYIQNYRHHLYTYRHEWVSETLYMKMSTQYIACSQRQMHTCIFTIQLYFMSIQPATKAIEHRISSYN